MQISVDIQWAYRDKVLCDDPNEIFHDVDRIEEDYGDGLPTKFPQNMYSLVWQYDNI